MRRWLLLCMSVCFGDDAQEERGGLIWTEGGWNNQVLARLQHQELHHFAWVHVGLGLGDGRMRFEEGGRKLSVVCLVLWLGKGVQLGRNVQTLVQGCKLTVENQPVSYLISHLVGNRQRTFTLVSKSHSINLSPFDFPVLLLFFATRRGLKSLWFFTLTKLEFDQQNYWLFLRFRVKQQQIKICM